MTATHRDDKHIEAAWKRADTKEIEQLAEKLVEKAQADVELDLSRVLYLAFRSGYLAAM